MKRLLIVMAIFFIVNTSYGQINIKAEDAGKHIGEKVTICLKVYGTKVLEKSGMTFLNVGAAYPNSPLTIVIFGKDRNNFPKKPDKLYSDKKICVTGEIKKYNGKNEIVVSKPTEIIIE